MAKKISELTAVTTPADTDEFAVNQSGTSKKETRAQIKTGAFDLDGSTLTLDADADTTIESATDDRVQVTVGGERVLTATLGKVEARSTDAGAGNGPQLTILRESASPAAADQIGYVSFVGMDSGAAQQTYATIQGIINDPTAASEDGKLSLSVVKAGSLTEVVRFSEIGTEFTQTVDFNAQAIEAHLGKVVTSVTGTLTTTAHSGNILVTSGNVTVPSTAGFNCTLIAGGAHTVSFNDGTLKTSPAMASGDIMSIVVQSSTVIHAVLVAAADKVTFT